MIVDILGIRVNIIERTAFYSNICCQLRGESKQRVSKINTEFITRAFKNDTFKEALNSFELSIADGRGVLWAARYLTLQISNMRLIRPVQAVWQMLYSGVSIVFYPKFISYPIMENIPGVDALKLMLVGATETDSGVFFFGATQLDLDSAVENIKNEMPMLKINGVLNGYDFQNDKSIVPVDIINKTDAKLLIVALGSPLQEYWIRDNLDKLKHIRIAVGEGGSLAFLAGSLRRAPNWMQKSGLEWLWRLFTNKSLTHQTGSRLKRVWNAVPIFIYEVVRWKVKHGATEVK